MEEGRLERVIGEEQERKMRRCGRGREREREGISSDKAVFVVKGIGRGLMTVRAKVSRGSCAAVGLSYRPAKPVTSFVTCLRI